MGDKWGREDKGFALIMVLGFSTLLLFMGGALLSYSVQEQRISRFQEEEVRLYYAAEAGLELGLATLRQDFYREEELTGNFKEGEEGIEYQVNFYQETSSSRRMVSTASQGDMDFNLSAVAVLQPPYDKALVGTRELTLQESEVKGDVHAGGEFRIAGSSVIDPLEGDEAVPFSYSEGLSTEFMDGQAELIIDGETCSSPAEIKEAGKETSYFDLPPVDFSAAEEEEECILQGADEYELPRDWPPCYQPGKPLKMAVEGDLLVLPEEDSTLTLDGLVVVWGDLTVEVPEGATAYLNGAFLVAGEVSLQGDVRVSSPGGGSLSENSSGVAFIAKEGISVVGIKESPDLSAGKVLFYTPAEVDISLLPDDPEEELDSEEQKQEIRGALLAGKIGLQKSSLHHEPIVVSLFQPYLPGLEIELCCWEEGVIEKE